MQCSMALRPSEGKNVGKPKAGSLSHVPAVAAAGLDVFQHSMPRRHYHDLSRCRGNTSNDSQYRQPAQQSSEHVRVLRKQPFAGLWDLPRNSAQERHFSQFTKENGPVNNEADGEHDHFPIARSLEWAVNTKSLFGRTHQALARRGHKQADAPQDGEVRGSPRASPWRGRSGLCLVRKLG